LKPVRLIKGAVSHLDRANVDTDQIMPKQFLKRIERTGFGQFLFYDWAQEPGWDLPPNPILVTGENFGCGSSREHAPWGLQDYGFETILAPSFADIFYSNCTKIGLLPVVLEQEHCRALARAGEGEVDLEAQEVRYAGPSGEPVRVPFAIDPETRRRLLAGLDDIALTLSEQAQAIERYERQRAQQPPSLPLTTAL
jgi:3-isopropylmalate/(R)-2-methylmalate dehydratase small subunit